MRKKISSFIHDFLAPKHYLALLISLLSLTIIAPLIDHDIWTRVIICTFLVFSLLTAILAVNKSKRTTLVSFSIVTIASIMWFLSFTFNVAPFNSAYFQIATFAVTLLFLIATGSVMWQDIYSGAATTNRICGAVCLYLLIGFCFAMLHLMVALQNPNAYRDSLRPETKNHIGVHRHYPFFVYFSFCTLTTVGYGDISPASRLSRSLAWVEAVTGQLYLAILVARLVGSHIASKANS